MDKTGFIIQAKNSRFNYHTVVVLITLFVFLMAIGILLSAYSINSSGTNETFSNLLFSMFPIYFIIAIVGLLVVWKKSKLDQSWTVLINPEKITFQIFDKKTKKETKNSYSLKKLKRVGIKKSNYFAISDKEGYSSRNVFDFDKEQIVLWGGNPHEMQSFIDKSLVEYGVKYSKDIAGNYTTYSLN